VSVLLNRPPAPYLNAGLTVETIDEAGMTYAVGFGTEPAGEGGPVTAHFRSSDPLAILPPPRTFTAGRGQEARVTFRTRGAQTVTVTDADGKWLPVSRAAWVHRPGDLRLLLSGPDSVEAGRPFGVTVHVKDRLDQWTKGYGGTVRFRCTDARARLPADYTFDRVETTHAFTSALTLPNPGRWTLTVSDPAVKGLSASRTVTVTPRKGD
jgi:hypothetical protein